MRSGTKLFSQNINFRDWRNLVFSPLFAKSLVIVLLLLVLMSLIPTLSCHKDLPFLITQQTRLILQNLLPIYYGVVPQLCCPYLRNLLMTALTKLCLFHIAITSVAWKQYSFLILFTAANLS